MFSPGAQAAGPGAALFIPEEPSTLQSLLGGSHHHCGASFSSSTYRMNRRPTSHMEAPWTEPSRSAITKGTVGDGCDPPTHGGLGSYATGPQPKGLVSRWSLGGPQAMGCLGAWNALEREPAKQNGGDPARNRPTNQPTYIKDARATPCGTRLCPPMSGGSGPLGGGKHDAPTSAGMCEGRPT